MMDTTSSEEKEEKQEETPSQNEEQPQESSNMEESIKTAEETPVSPQVEEPTTEVIKPVSPRQQPTAVAHQQPVESPFIPQPKRDSNQGLHVLESLFGYGMKGLSTGC